MNFSTAYWCVLIAAVLPYIWSYVAKANGSKFDNRNPRDWLAKQENPRSAHANAAQLNAFEAFAPFAAAVLMAQLAGVDGRQAGLLAIVFVVFRVLHGVFYLIDRDRLRSLCWLGGFICVIALLVQAALSVGA